MLKYSLIIMPLSFALKEACSGFAEQSFAELLPTISNPKLLRGDNGLIVPVFGFIDIYQ